MVSGPACDRGWSIRLVVRQTSELLLARGARFRALFATDQLADIIVETVLSASMAHLPLREAGHWIAIGDAVRLGRPVSAAAIAQSMQLAETTVRRRAAILVDAGLLWREPGGFRLAAEFGTGGAIADVVAANAADLFRTLEQLARAGYEPAVRAVATGVPSLPAGVVERPLLVFALRVLEQFTALYGDVTGGTLVAAIVAANVRHVTDDPALARAYASEGAIPPDAERRPLSLRALARSTGIPFETVRRRVDALIAAGIAARGVAGVIVPSAVLGGARHTANNRRIVDHFDALLEQLTTLAGSA